MIETVSAGDGGHQSLATDHTMLAQNFVPSFSQFGGLSRSYCRVLSIFPLEQTAVTSSQSQCALQRLLKAAVAITIGLQFLLGATLASAQAAAPPAEHNISLKLEAESDHPRAGSTVTLALVSEPRPGWHGYWRNPGDAGFVPMFDWVVPKGVSVSEPAWPVPSTLLINGLMSYVYDAPYTLLIRVSVPVNLAHGTKLPIRLRARYLACTLEVCLPEMNEAAIDLVVGDGAAIRTTEFDRWRRATPMPLGSPASWSLSDGAAHFAIPFPKEAPLGAAYLFPVTPGAFDAAAPQKITRDGDRLLVEVKRNANGGEPIDAVLRIGTGRGLSLHASYQAASLGGVGADVLLATLAAFAGAVLGGLLLNAMPCVFPILSLKALALARAGTGDREASTEALGYTAGVMATTVALGALLLALRAGGQEVGWAFQIQNAPTLTLLMVLSAAIGFNLAGLFEVPTPSFVQDDGRAGAFGTGALAAIVATPCSGPFMGVALGSALLLPWPAAIAIFAGLGLGLALPYLAIGFVPRLRAMLPKPGPWLVTARRVLAIPMLLTAVALAWVLGRLAGADAQATGLLAVLLTGLLLWLGGLRQGDGRALGWPISAAFLAVAGGAAALVGQARAPGVVPSRLAGDVEAFSEARLAALTGEGRPVFVYFTADWCLTCKVNERTSIDQATVRTAFERSGVKVLRGDWTSGDPLLGRFIEAHGHAGVPLYLFYATGWAPRVLPQVLTPGTLTGLVAA